MEFVFGIVCFLFTMAMVIAIIASVWKVFEKAGQPGWAALVPIYNAYILTCEIAKKEILWFVLQFVPFVGIVAAIMVSIDVARKFGKSEAFGIGLAFLPFVFYPMLGFGDARYQGGRRSLDYDDEDDYEDEPKPKKKKPQRDYDDE